MPRHLKIVAWAFIFVGLLALVQTIYTLLKQPVVNINFLIVFIFVGFGLLKKRPLWRTFAISCSIVVLIILIANIIFVATGQKSLTGLPTGILVTFWAQSVIGIAASAYALWALQSSEVRAVFDK